MPGMLANAAAGMPGTGATVAGALAQVRENGYTGAMQCANSEKNARRCTCTYPGCPRHGICCDCVAYHRAAGELPGCFFGEAEERTYDRSIGYFMTSRR